MFELIRADLHRVVPGSYSLAKLLKGFRSKGFKYLFFMRLAGQSQFLIARVFFRIVLRHYTYKYGFQIPPQAKIGGGLFIGHFGTVVISTQAIIGRNCNLAHSITIGATRRGPSKGAPHLGDFVWVGTGAVLVGKIKIGTHVLIAPNAYVNFDVPDNSLVIGNPGRIIPRENPVLDYINNSYSFIGS
jgi:serine O-acetyltransferase